MTRKQFRKRIERAFRGCKIEYARNEVEYLANVASDLDGFSLACQAGPYAEEVRMFWHGQFTGFVA